MHILLTEDNLVNQRLAVRLLEKNGYTVKVANNGREAIQALEQEHFDLTLMDIQMPEMDGFEATAVIRERERRTGAHLPIIAMTAHAMQGDRERCLAAGMDAYISKPIQTTELFKLIAELAPTPARVAPPPAPHNSQPEAFDQAVALARVEGDWELLAELIELFADDSPRLLLEIEQAIVRGEGSGLVRSAHALKGAASNFGAEIVVGLAGRLEGFGQAGQISEAQAAYPQLEAEVARLKAALSGMVTQVGVAA